VDWIRTRFTSAHAIALVALFVALGGTGYAALKLPKNSVSAKQIAKNAVRSGEVKNGSLKKGDFAAGQLPAGPQGAQGPQGPQGLQGVPGDAGPAGVVGAITVMRNDITLPAGPGANQPGAEVDGFETCPAGTRMIGGSVNTSSPSGAEVLISRPSTDNVGNGGIPDDGESFSFWKGTARTRTNASASMRVFAFCAQTP
jgi:hypothetical protein